MCDDGEVATVTVKEIQEKYLCMYPVEDINFKGLFLPDLSYSCCCEQQEDLLRATIASEVSRRFPPKLSYTKTFLKSLIEQLEQLGHEVLQEFYTSYTNLLAGSGLVQSLPCTVFGGAAQEGSFYRTYSPWRGGRVTLRETSNVVAEGTTGLRTWQAAHVLLQHLLENPGIVERKRVVELGAGIGLLGLGVVLRGLPLRYIFTDGHPTVLDSLRHNLALNLSGGDSKLSSHEAPEWTHGDCLVRLASLDWQCQDSARGVADCDVILAADVVFDPSLFDVLLKTLSFLLRATVGNTTTEGELEVPAAGCPPSPSSPLESHRLALLAVTIRNEANYNHFLDCIGEHDLQLLSVQDCTYREAPSRPEHSVKLLRLAAAHS